MAGLSASAGFEYDVRTLGISVAALMHVDWIRGKLGDVTGFDRVLLPGWCQGEVSELTRQFGVEFAVGPKNLFDLPAYFGSTAQRDVTLTEYDIEIVAEINHAPRLADDAILHQSEHYRAAGADVIDLGCIPGERWNRAGQVTRQLCDAGFRVSIDSFDRQEVESAVAGGAELVLSCNSANRDWASELDAELVAIPDDPRDPASLEQTVGMLRAANCRFRIDPILEPIGFGFAASLARYFHTREKWPDVEVLMGIGNLTELSEADTGGMNLLLAGLCQELGIRSVLTTEVINWARSAVAEFDVARRLSHYSVHHSVLPKHVDDRLVMLRDPSLREAGPEAIADLVRGIKDPNFRILVDSGEIHVINRDGHWRGVDPYALFDEFEAVSGPLEPSHSFYLGYELAKAKTALTLGKQYTQDEALRWGMLSVPEISARERRRQSRRGDGPD